MPAAAGSSRSPRPSGRAARGSKAAFLDKRAGPGRGVALEPGERGRRRATRDEQFRSRIPGRQFDGGQARTYGSEVDGVRGSRAPVRTRSSGPSMSTPRRQRRRRSSTGIPATSASQRGRALSPGRSGSSGRRSTRAMASTSRNIGCWRARAARRSWRPSRTRGDRPGSRAGSRPNRGRRGHRIARRERDPGTAPERPSIGGAGHHRDSGRLRRPRSRGGAVRRVGPGLGHPPNERTHRRVRQRVEDAHGDRRHRPSLAGASASAIDCGGRPPAPR